MLHHLHSLFSDLRTGIPQIDSKLRSGNCSCGITFDHFCDLFQDLRYESGTSTFGSPVRSEMRSWGASMITSTVSSTRSPGEGKLSG